MSMSTASYYQYIQNYILDLYRNPCQDGYKKVQKLLKKYGVAEWCKLKDDDIYPFLSELREIHELHWT